MKNYLEGDTRTKEEIREGIRQRLSLPISFKVVGYRELTDEDRKEVEEYKKREEQRRKEKEQGKDSK